MIKLIKGLFKREPKPDVLVFDHNGVVRLCVSRIVGRRRVVEYNGEVLLLSDDGTVRGGYWVKIWEAM